MCTFDISDNAVVVCLFVYVCLLFRSTASVAQKLKSVQRHVRTMNKTIDAVRTTNLGFFGACLLSRIRIVSIEQLKRKQLFDEQMKAARTAATLSHTVTKMQIDAIELRRFVFFFMLRNIVVVLVATADASTVAKSVELCCRGQRWSAEKSYVWSVSIINKHHLSRNECWQYVMRRRDMAKRSRCVSICFSSRTMSCVCAVLH